jgi:lysophospholipase L1-like esterase
MRDANGVRLDSLPIVGPLSPRGAGSIAWLGDSLTANGSNNGSNTGQAVCTLHSASAIGSTSLSLDYALTAANGYTNVTPPGTAVKYVIDEGTATEEWFVPSAVSGSGPYTLTVPAMTYAHAANAPIRNVATQFACNSVPLWVAMLSGDRLRFGGLYAHGGYTAAQVQSVYLPQVLAATPRPGACVVNVGTNDAWSSAAMTTALQIIDSLRKAGIMPVVTAAPPGGQIAANGNISAANKWNHRMSAECAKRGIPYVDTYSAITDDGSGGNPGSYKFKYNVDNTHPSEIGARAWAQAIVTALTAWWPFYADPIAAPINTVIDGTAYPFSTNAVMLTDSNSDGVPDSWNVGTKNAADTIALVSETGVPGKMLSLTRAANQPAGTPTSVFRGVPSALTAGHKYRIYVRLKTSGLDAAYEAQRTTTGAGSGLTSSAFPGFTFDFSGDSNHALFTMGTWNLDVGLTVFSRDFVCPKGITLTPAVVVTLNGGTSTPAYTVEFQAFIVDLTYIGAS